MFEWDRNNLRKIQAHAIGRDEVEQVIQNDPIAIYEQNLPDELRFLYYGETNRGRMLAVVLTELVDAIRVVTAYDLDAGQKQDYLRRRLQGE